MSKKYKTIVRVAEAELTEKKSRFLAKVMPIETEEQARAFVEKIKKQYWDASHHVFAYRLGREGALQRFSDDGEPQGTAGRPVLGVLEKEEVCNAIVVVVRYFGGTLLGTGGLVRAYGKAAKAGIDAAGIAKVGLYQKVHIYCSYSISGGVEHELRQNGFSVLDTVYTDRVEFIVLAEPEHLEALENKIQDRTNGQAEIFPGEEIQMAYWNGQGYQWQGKPLEF